MILVLFTALLVAAPTAGYSETVVTTRTMSANSELTRMDVETTPENTEGAHRSLDAVVGRRAKTILYAGQPVMKGQLARSIDIRRNEIIKITYRNSGLTIEAEARALDEGSIGEKIRAMNTESRQVTTAIVVDKGIATASESENDQ